jgi:glycosyltransferase involved in cell wall biosynthesis
MKKFLWMLCYLQEKDNKKVQRFIESIPKNMLGDERIQKIRHSILPSKTWDKKSIVIFCGECWEEWADPSVISGLGGSEEAVVYLSREFVKLGYNVTVFNNCAEFEGTYNGVSYQPFYNFNPNDAYNILIGWRGNIFKFGQLKARRKLIWTHDVPQGDQFYEKEIDTFDKLIVLSEYHKTLFPKYIPDDKYFISSNGVNLKDFEKNGVMRNPHRMIYTSSYDRGIQHLLLRWDEIRKEFPDAELHIFYGWDIYDNMAKKGFRTWDFKEKMVELMKQEGVFEHGRIGHKQLVKEFQKSGLYVYPCHFQEISCISAMKAQSCGCVPVVTGFAALKETVKDGIMVNGSAESPEVMDEYIKALITNLKDNESLEDLRNHVLEHKEEFGWNKVALQWHNDLF